VFFLLTSAVGASLASEGTQLAVTLASHIGLALVTLVLAGYGAGMLSSAYRTVPQVAARLAALSALVGVLAGSVFYVTNSLAALYLMEGFGSLGILCGLLMIVFGGPSGRKAPATPVPQ
jgi:hypothetical protein